MPFRYVGKNFAQNSSFLKKRSQNAFAKKRRQNNAFLQTFSHRQASVLANTF